MNVTKINKAIKIFSRKLSAHKHKHNKFIVVWETYDRAITSLRTNGGNTSEYLITICLRQ